MTRFLFLAKFLLVLIPCLALAQNSSAGKTASDTIVSAKDADVTLPVVRHAPNPKYPPAAIAAGHQGTCRLTLIVGADGHPRDIHVTHRLYDELDESAVAAASKWRFKPARKAGQPVAVKIDVQQVFRLRNGSNRAIADLWDRSDRADPKAEWALWKIYFEGNGVEKNETLGLWFLKRAADWNLPEAQFQMGEQLYRHSNGPPDYVTAYMWYALSKRAGGKDGEPMLRELAAKMSPEQISQAEERVDYWPEDPPKQSQ